MGREECYSKKNCELLCLGLLIISTKLKKYIYIFRIISYRVVRVTCVEANEKLERVPDRATFKKNPVVPVKRHV